MTSLISEMVYDFNRIHVQASSMEQNMGPIKIKDNDGANSLYVLLLRIDGIQEKI